MVIFNWHQWGILIVTVQVRVESELQPVFTGVRTTGRLPERVLGILLALGCGPAALGLILAIGGEGPD